MDTDNILLNITTGRSVKRKAANAAKSETQAKRSAVDQPTEPAGERVVPHSANPFDANSFNADASDNFYDDSHNFPQRPHESMQINPAIDEGTVMASATETLFSQDSFQSLALHSYLVKNITDKLGFTKVTLVQKLGIPAVQRGGDVLVKSQTGSGKTLVYALPVLNKLGTADPPITRSDGVQCLVILPTRELAVQSFDVFHRLCQSFIKVTPGCLSGGEKKKSEKARLRKGINILVSTPGRLLDHLKTSASLTLSLSKLQFLVIDEADRLLEAGFDHQVGEILQIVRQSVGDRSWQTILLSATLTPAVERLASLSLSNNPEYIDVQALSAAARSANGDQYAIAEPVLAVPENLKQYYAVTPTKLKFAAMTAFLLQKRRTKVVVFCPTQDIVEFLFSTYENVFDQLVVKFTPPSAAINPSEKTKLFRLHGEMSQSERSDVFRRFSQSDSGFLFSTDVAARGLDLPSITWVVQFQAPETPSVYVHRVGRTARAGRSGSSLLFLIPNETAYVKMMRQDFGMNLKSIRFSSITAAIDNKPNNGQPPRKDDVIRVIFEIQHSIDEAVNGEKKLSDMARKAYVSFVRCYATYRHDQREIFNVRNGLHFGHVARAFGLKDESPTEINNILRRNSAPPRRPEWRREARPNYSNVPENVPVQRSSAPAPSQAPNYPTWQGTTYSRHESGAGLKEPAAKPTKLRPGTRVMNNRRAGGPDGYQVAMQRCSEFASGL